MHGDENGKPSRILISNTSDTIMQAGIEPLGMVYPIPAHEAIEIQTDLIGFGRLEVESHDGGLSLWLYGRTRLFDLKGQLIDDLPASGRKVDQGRSKTLYLSNGYDRPFSVFIDGAPTAAVNAGESEEFNIRPSDAPLNIRCNIATVTLDGWKESE